MIELTREVKARVGDKFDHISSNTILSFYNMLRTLRILSEQELKEVMNILACSETPNLNLIFHYFNAFSTKKQNNNPSFFIELDVEKSQIPLCYKKVSLV